jgi:hypothetical protein
VKHAKAGRAWLGRARRGMACRGGAWLVKAREVSESMQQIDLLPIPRQPQRPEEVAIPTRVIKAYVRDCLKGMAARQAERERRRRAKRQPKTKLTMPTLFDMEPTEEQQNA